MALSHERVLLNAGEPSALYRAGQLPIASMSPKLHATCSKQLYILRKSHSGGQQWSGECEAKVFDSFPLFAKTNKSC